MLWAIVPLTGDRVDWAILERTNFWAVLRGV
jgi:hypothetical protein